MSLTLRLQKDNDMAKIRWGILGPGWVADKFASGLRCAEGGVLEAVASKSSLERASAFAQKYGIKKVYSSYEELLEDPDVDVVYISTLNSEHKKIALACFAAGKHVVCEKPIALNEKETKEMIDAAKKANCFLMDAMWSRFLPVVTQIKMWIQEGRIGEVKMVQANTGYRIMNRGGRHFDVCTGGGALLDLGVYALYFASMVFGWEPVEIKSSAFIGEKQVDEQAAIILNYPNGQLAILSCSFLTEAQQEAWIIGTEGTIVLKPAFANADHVQLICGGVLSERTVIEEMRFPSEGNGYHYEAEEAMKCLREGKLESGLLPLEETLGVMKIMDRIRGQWGLVFPGE